MDCSLIHQLLYVVLI